MSMGDGGNPLGGLFGGGGGWAQPTGPYGPWAGCGCSSLLMILAGIMLVFAGCLRMVNF